MSSLVKKSGGGGVADSPKPGATPKVSSRNVVKQIEEVKRSRAEAIVLEAELKRAQARPTPLAAWRDAAAAILPTRPARPVFNRLLALKPVVGFLPLCIAPSRPRPEPTETVSFSGCELSIIELKVIGASLRASLTLPIFRAPLRELDLSHCGIDVRGAAVLAKGLIGNTGLERLNLKDNPLCSPGVALVMRALLASTKWLADETQWDRFGRPVRPRKRIPDSIAQAGVLDPVAIALASGIPFAQPGEDYRAEDDLDPRGATADVISHRECVSTEGEQLISRCREMFAFYR
jgi:hypothetical protein